MRKIMLIGPGHILFAMAAVSFAFLSLAYSDFAPMWDKVPTEFPGRELCVWAVSVILLIASVGLCFRATARTSLFAIGLYYGMWWVFSTPPILNHPLSVGVWYGVCEAASSIAGAWVLLSLLRGTTTYGTQAALIVFGMTCVFYGWSHFAYLDYTATFVPAWLPGHRELAAVTGLAHLAAGVALIMGVLPRLAATLEAMMMSLFGVLVWLPSFFAQPHPNWAGTDQNQWSELAVNLLLAGSAWIMADSLGTAPWGLRTRRTKPPALASTSP